MKFHVQGFKHKGFLQVVLNEGEDLFEVTLISEEGETVNRIEHIFVDNLISIIDDAVEKTEDYEKRISQEYGIITETEKWEKVGFSRQFWRVPLFLNNTKRRFNIFQTNG